MTLNNNVVNHENNAPVKRSHFDSGLPDLNKRKPYVRLPILMSCRVRLSDSQRKILKDGYNTLRNQHIPQPQKMAGSTVSSTTQVNPDQMLGLNSIVMADLLGTRESIPLETILRIQKVLNVVAVTRDEVAEACESYLDWMFVRKFADE